jgi:tRNA(fMet)-specific endonuclease VapC
MYLLDTNTWIRFLNREPNPVKQRITSTDPKFLRFCSVVKAELYFGAENSTRKSENLATLKSLFAGIESLPFDDPAAIKYGKIRAALKKAGTPIGPNDLMIASIAMARQAVLVTHNIAEFSRVEGLQIDDWEVQ